MKFEEMILEKTGGPGKVVRGLASVPAYLAVMSSCYQERMCLMTGQQGCPAEPTAGTHFKVSHWQPGTPLLCVYATPSQPEEPSRAPQGSVQAALMSQPPRGQATQQPGS